MQQEIIERFSVIAFSQRLSYRDMADRSKIPASTICGAFKHRSASAETITKMIRFIKKEEELRNANIDR